MRIDGLFDWTRRNDVRAVVFLLAFALLTQPMAMAFLVIPLAWLDPHHAPWFGWAGYAARYAPPVAIASAVYFAVRMWYHVNSVRRDLPFRFVDRSEEPRLCGLIEPLAIAAGVRAPHVGVIEDSAINAFACGAPPGFTVVVFTRGLIDSLDDDELSAVIAHELIHIRNGDTRLIAACERLPRGSRAAERRREAQMAARAQRLADGLRFFLSLDRSGGISADAVRPRLAAADLLGARIRRRRRGDPAHAGPRRLRLGAAAHRRPQRAGQSRAGAGRNDDRRRDSRGVGLASFHRRAHSGHRRRDRLACDGGAVAP